MFTYLQNAIGLFQNPASIGMMLSQYMSPIGKIEIFEADGINNTFIVDESLIDIINGNNLNGINFSYIENGEYVKGSYNLEEQKVSFPDILPSGQEYAFEVYFCGEFVGDFNKFNSLTDKGNLMFVERIKDILARLLVRSWAENERNFLLDIRNIMTDTDFKIMSNDKILKSKNEWINQLDNEIFQLQNRLAWSMRFTYTSTNIGRG